MTHEPPLENPIGMCKYCKGHGGIQTTDCDSGAVETCSHCDGSGVEPMETLEQYLNNYGFDDAIGMGLIIGADDVAIFIKTIRQIIVMEYRNLIVESTGMKPKAIFELDLLASLIINKEK